MSDPRGRGAAAAPQLPAQPDLAHPVPRLPQTAHLPRPLRQQHRGDQWTQRPPLPQGSHARQKQVRFVVDLKIYIYK